MQLNNNFTHSKVIQVFVLCKLEIDDVIGGYGIESSHEMKKCLERMGHGSP